MSASYNTQRNTNSSKRDELTAQCQRAVENDDLVVLRRLLDYKPGLASERSYNDSAYFGETPLHTAARRGHCGALGMLIAAGGAGNPRSWDQSTPIHHAAAHGQAPALNMLLMVPRAAVDAVDRCRRTPLWLAAAMGHVEAMSALCRAGADPLKSNLCHTCQPKQRGGGKAPKEGGEPCVVCAQNHQAPLHAAARAGQTLAVRFLLEHTPQARHLSTKSGELALHIAAEEGHIGTVEQLLEAGCPINAETALGQTPLELAAAEGHAVVVALLLQNGAEVEARISTALHAAAARGSLGALNALLTPRCSQSPSIASPMGSLPSASPSNTSVSQSIKPPSVPRDSSTHRSQASAGGGARCDVWDAMRQTPLHVAADHAHDGVVRALLSARAVVTVRRGADEFTPMDCAVVSNEEDSHLFTILALLEHPDACHDSKLSPLHVSAYRNCLRTVEALVQHGLPVDAPNEAGVTPLQIARGEHHTLLAAWIEGWIASAQGQQGFHQARRSSLGPCTGSSLGPEGPGSEHGGPSGVQLPSDATDATDATPPSGAAMFLEGLEALQQEMAQGSLEELHLDTDRTRASDVSGGVQDLCELRDQGVLSAEQYHEEKALLLEERRQAQAAQAHGAANWRGVTSRSQPGGVSPPHAADPSGAISQDLVAQVLQFAVDGGHLDLVASLSPQVQDRARPLQPHDTRLSSERLGASRCDTLTELRGLVQEGYVPQSEFEAEKSAILSDWRASRSSVPKTPKSSPGRR